MGNNLTRRNFLKGTAAAAAGLMTGCSASGLPLKGGVFPALNQQDLPFLGLATSLQEEYTYEAFVEGVIPRGLRGTLYRNTCGLFERNGLRKRMLFDGDGMIQAFRFHDSGVTYMNRYVKTKKYNDESQAGRFLYPTFSTQAPGGLLSNFWPGDSIMSQAHISVILWNDQLLALDESAKPWDLDPLTLETRGETALEVPGKPLVFGPHPKIDVQSRECVFFGLHYGRSVTVLLTVIGSHGEVVRRRAVSLPRYVHIHDFFVSRRHIVFNLHPFELSLPGFLLGLNSMADSLRWTPAKGNLFMILDRHTDSPPVLIETEPCFLWHSVNTFDEDGIIVADCIGYRSPDHMIGPDPPVSAVMEGRPGSFEHRGKLFRYRIDPSARKVFRELLSGEGYEWPMIHPHLRCHRYRLAYCAVSRKEDFFWSGIARIDTVTGQTTRFFFPEGQFCGEPVFAPLPLHSCVPDDPAEPGWLLTEVYDGGTKKSFLSILRADRLDDGPVANVHLLHHVPYSMHGFWADSGELQRPLPPLPR